VIAILKIFFKKQKIKTKSKKKNQTIYAQNPLYQYQPTEGRSQPKAAAMIRPLHTVQRDTFL